MAEKILNTRVQLKYDSYSEWQKVQSTFKPLKGEICIVNPGTKLNDASVVPCLMKVGDGEHFFIDLPWISATAADVYAWAKSKEIIAVGDGNAVTGVTVRTNEDGTSSVVLNKGETFATAAQLSDLSGRVDAIDTDTDTRYSFEKVDVKTDENYGKLKITAQRYNVKTSANIGNPVYSYVDLVTPDELTTILANYYTKDEVDDLLEDIEEQIGAIDTGVHSVTLTGGTNQGTLKLTVDNVPTDNIAVTGLQDAAYTTVTALNATAKGYADAVEGKFNAYNTAHTNDYTNAQIDSLIAGAKQYADDNDANTEYHVEYDATAKKIKLVAGADAAKMEIDATDFIKDGMLQSVELVQEDAEGNKGQFLKLTWNDDGNDVTYVSVGALVDVYTAANNATEVQVAISNTNVVSATLVNGGVTTAKLADDAVTSDKLDDSINTDIAKGVTAHSWGNHANAGYAANADLTKVINGDTPVAKATNADQLGGQLPAYYATKASVTDITKDNGTIDTKIAAYNTSKNFGDIITHDDAEYVKEANVAVGANNNTVVKRTADGHIKAASTVTHSGYSDGESAEYADCVPTKSDVYTLIENQPAVELAQKVLNLMENDANELKVLSVGMREPMMIDVVQTVETTRNGGLKVAQSGSTATIDIDDAVTFIFDCGSATKNV